jgi:7,8-dihydro-6-hydroxymethylpterin-pyrophosphokinase
MSGKWIPLSSATASSTYIDQESYLKMPHGRYHSRNFLPYITIENSSSFAFVKNQKTVRQPPLDSSQDKAREVDGSTHCASSL